MNENIDWENIAKRLQSENEELRIGILQSRNRQLNINIDVDKISRFVENNYAIVLLCIVAAYYIVSLILDVHHDRRISK